MIFSASPHRDAIRLLFILVEGSSSLLSSHPSGATLIFQGETRLLAFEFWVRNPDYLAAELLDRFEQTGEKELLAEIDSIFAEDEPDIRRIPMIRYLRGAYEKLDDALSILRSRDLVRIERKGKGVKIYETDFIIMPKAQEVAKKIVADFPDLSWYSRRARLIAAIAGTDGGKALKARQYERVQYAETRLGGIIPSIADETRERLKILKNESVEGAEVAKYD